MCAGSAEEAEAAVRRAAPDVALIDVRMPGVDGIGFLGILRELSPFTVPIVMTAYSSWQKAVEAMRQGAFGYIAKPFDNDRLKAMISRAMEQSALARSGTKDVPELLIGSSPAMEGVFRAIRQCAPTDITVLITGESGTGKELAARAVHIGSPRRSGVFLAVNCASFPETLLESELFGYRKGAFTGAAHDKKGLVEAAEGGTLLVDEIGEMPLSLQAKLLRVLESGEFIPLGATEPKRVDVRFIASTNRDLEKEVAAGRFRADLFYRLNVFRIRMPPLRDRREDIPLLCGYFLSKYGRSFGKELAGITDDAMRLLMNHDWPGNVRELENVLKRAVVTAAGKQITPEDLVPSLGGRVESPPAGVDLPVDLEKHLEEMERAYIREALRRTGGNLTKAAELLGLSFRSMRYRVKKLGIRTD